MPARLYHERIARDGAAPARWLLLTHGIYGTGANWRGIARKVNERRPDWGIVLVDLRGHGRSEAGDPPHTIAACAEDVRALAATLAAETPAVWVAALAGHSFGGKVMLAARSLIEVAQTWLLDSSPSQRGDPGTDRDNSVLRVLALMERLPRTWARRDAFVTALVEAGQEVALAQWLAMSLVPTAAGALKLRFDLVALRAMLADYYAVDLWEPLLDPQRGSVELVISERSRVFTDDDRLRLLRAPPHVHAYHVNAGHWLHIDASAVVIDLLVEQLPR